MPACYTDQIAMAIPLTPLTPEQWSPWLAEQPAVVRHWLQANGRQGEPGTLCLIPNAEGHLMRVVVGLAATPDLFALADLPERLPPRRYTLESTHPRYADWALGWGLGAYRFTTYLQRPAARAPTQLYLPATPWAIQVRRQLTALHRVRDLINTPAADMLPPQLAAAVHEVAALYGAKVSEVIGEALLSAGYPLVHAVGRAGHAPPRMIELLWGDASAPCLTLVGKGVCFDTGGLNLKPAGGMRLMKKDMGGAAHALGLAELIMAMGLAVRLRLLIPAVENAIAAHAMRPGDILRSRRGLTVEIENTDAEGRLILADALTAAAEAKPDLIIDFATLTGAARTALGTEIPAFFTNDEALAADLMAHDPLLADPLWRLPLHDGYREQLDSQIADLMNASEGRYGGAITAALFLREFVGHELPWLHVDLMAWNLRARPGRPKGGEAMGLRAVFAAIERRYGNVTVSPGEGGRPAR